MTQNNSETINPPENGGARVVFTGSPDSGLPLSHEFQRADKFQFNPNTGFLVFTHSEGEFGLRIDTLRYFQVCVPPQEGEITHTICRVSLVPETGDTPEILEIADVIKENWHTDNGLLMVYGRNHTTGIHLDQVISYTVS